MELSCQGRCVARVPALTLALMGRLRPQSDKIEISRRPKISPLAWGGKWRTKTSRRTSSRLTSIAYAFVAHFTDRICIKSDLYTVRWQRPQTRRPGCTYMILRHCAALVGLKAMQYQLSFLDDTGRAREVCKSDFEADSTAILWMRIVGAERSLRPDWSLMELRCKRRWSPVFPLAFFGELGIPSGISGEAFKPHLSNPF
jgi:hypothetical protein